MSDSTASALRLVMPITLVGGMTADRLRLEHLRGRDSLDGFMIRSASSLTPRPAQAKGWSTSLIAPELYAVNNSAIPFSLNDGALWAGVGTSARILFGAQVAAGPFRLILAPEIVRSENAYFLLRDTVRFYAPPAPKARPGWCR